jgi:hypothetical protein
MDKKVKQEYKPQEPDPSSNTQRKRSGKPAITLASKTKTTTETRRYIVRLGRLTATFEVTHDAKMTFFDGPKSKQIKEYHFELSDPLVVKKVSALITECAKVALKAVKEMKHD